ncbi:MAG: peptidase M48 Ste24p, partial [Alphaproteobacteria bacterium]|nr:peptidase M48 Ste24p [Alphaproteobacteria bacterium]
MLPAFGLYTHIRANRIRSIFLIASLFALVYSLTFAFALAMNAMQFSHWRLESQIIKAFGDLGTVFPFVTLGTAAWVCVGYW